MRRNSLFAVTTAIAGLFALGACGEVDPKADDALGEAAEAARVDTPIPLVPSDGAAGQDPFAEGLAADELGLGDAGDAGDEVDPLDPSGDPPLIGAAPGSKKKPPFPAYIVHLQPVPGSNLETAVTAFIASHLTGNLAFSYFPHVTVTRFFQPKPFLSRSQLATRFGSAITAAGGTPFGQPTITGVVCQKGAGLVKLEVKTPATPRVQIIEPGGIKVVSKYFAFSREVVRFLHARGARRPLHTYHVTLYLASDPNDKELRTAYERACTDAHARFDGLMYANNAWQVVLFHASTQPTPTHPLTDRVAGPVRVTP